MTTAERVQHLEDMMCRLMALEKRSMELHTQSKAQLAEQRAEFAQYREDSNRWREYIEARMDEIDRRTPKDSE